MGEAIPRLIRSCPECLNRFSSRRTLRGHLRKTHNIFGKAAIAILSSCSIGEAAMQKEVDYKPLRRMGSRSVMRLKSEEPDHD